MMNRSTQKELIKLLLQLNEMWPQLDLSNMEQQNMVLDILNTVSTKCQKDFTKVNADQYVDTVESLGNVIKLTDWQHMESEELNQCLSLCQEIILQVINNLRNEKELKKDIVFLPYQASMWDSLESVWKAANEDKEHCNTYVIPIPYASLTPEHTAAEWHCERGLFPEYVPTLDWQTIDLEEMHPDVIFIHNPYDEYNRVTSVESRYYSSNLKHCTDKLVYIPYSVEEEIQPGNEAAENAIEHRVLLPAFLNADLIIAQSEDMRQAWINILTRRTNINNHAYWEKRILGLGSPKIDKVLTSKKEDFEMPEKWRKLIGNKKVILYITSIAPTLQNSDKVCAKLQYVFDIFRNRDDVVLWWRPHPLMKATFHSMRPQYEEEYLRLEKMYIEECWGIYDDSSDLHRAICWSDAYYGDWSSVMTLYRKTGKPIMLQNLQRKIELNYKCYFEYVTSDNDKLWAISQENFIGLYEMDLNTDEMKCLGELPIKNRQSLGRDLEYVAIEKVGNKLVMAPYFSRDGLIVYDMIQCTFTEILIRQDKLSDDAADMAFMYGFVHGNSVFFVGYRTGIIMEYSIKRNEILYHDKWSKVVRDKIGKEGMYFERQGYVKEGHFLYMVVSHTNFIVKLDVNTMESFIYRIPYDFQAINLCYDGDFFWITPLAGEYVVRWDELVDSYIKVYLPQRAEQFSFIGSGVVGNSVVLFPSMANYVLRIDRYSLSVVVDALLERYIIDINTDKYGMLKHESKRIFAYLKNRVMQEFDVTTGEMKIHHFKADFLVEKIIRLNSQYKESKNIISYDGEDMDICLWMEMFLQKNEQKKTISSGDMAGVKIYRKMMI